MIGADGVQVVSDAQNLGKEPFVAIFPDSVQASLSHLGSFARGQRHELFKTHGMLIRSQTHEIAALMNPVLDSSSSRAILVGPAGTGKTSLLAQAHALAKSAGWLVLHLGRPVNSVDGSTSAELQNGVWINSMYIRRWLARVRRSNKDVLEPSEVQNLRETAAEPAKLAETIEFLAEKRPILLTVDGINAWCRYPFAAIRDRENKPVYHGHMQIPKLVLQYLGGEKTFKQGAVLAATSSEFDNDKNVTINAGLGRTVPHAWSDITEYDPELAKAFKSVKPIDVQQLSYDEARAYLKYLEVAKIGPKANDAEVTRRYVLAGNGNIHALLSSCLNYGF